MSNKQLLQSAGDGTAVPAGYIGEIITASLSDVPTSTTTVNTAYNAGSISLTNGVWIVFGKCAWTFGSGGPVWNSFSASISTTSATVHGPTSNVDYSAGLVKEWVAGTRIITVTGGSQTVYLVAGVNYTTGGTVNPRLNAANEYLYAIRIA